MSDVHFVSGSEVAFEDKVDLLIEVRDWLEQHQPATKPKSVAELLVNADHSWFAFDEAPIFSPKGDNFGKLLGHVGACGLSPFIAPQPLGDVMVCRPALYEVASLVVATERQGQGIGKSLVGMVMDEWQGKVGDDAPDGFDFKLVDLVAMTCPQSMPVFEACGFSTEAEQEVHNTLWNYKKMAHVLQPCGIEKTPLGKLAWPVNGLIQIHHG
jgi:GNAT superfamily N-acetyltransferase